MRPAGRYLWGGLVGLSCQGSGCGEELGPEPMRTAPVAGRVRVGDRPIRGGWVEFLPVEGTVGRLCSAPMGPDGRFAAEAVAVGTNALRLVAPTADVAVPGGRLFQQRYLIRRVVPPGGTAGIDIDLRAEAAAVLAPPGRRPDGPPH